MNIIEVIKDEANMDISGAQNCTLIHDENGLLIAVTGLMTLRNICTKMNLLKLEVDIQNQIDLIGLAKMPELIK